MTKNYYHSPTDYRAYSFESSMTLDPYDCDLSPSFLDIKEYWEEVTHEGKFMSISWATNEIKQHLLNWCRVGIVAQQVKRFCKWKDLKLTSFKEYCETILGVSCGYINQIIKCAKVTLDLASMGFEVLPTNPSQAKHLLKFEGEDLKAAWQQVLDENPKHLITAKAIEKTLNPDKPERFSIQVSKKTWESFQKKALAKGLDPQEAIEELLGNWANDEDETSEEVEETEFSETEANTKTQLDPKKLEAWEKDLEQLVHDHDEFSPHKSQSSHVWEPPNYDPNFAPF